MSFRLVPKSVTLNDLERRNALILRYFTEFGSFRAHCLKVVEEIRVHFVLQIIYFYRYITYDDMIHMISTV